MQDLLRREAWVGDAVLTLFARLQVLDRDDTLDGARAARLTSNQFLSAVGEPTAVEAEIGRVFRKEGLEAAFAWIEGRVLPLFERQEANRRRRIG